MNDVPASKLATLVAVFFVTSVISVVTGSTSLITVRENLGTSMISKSQEETEVSLHFEDRGLEAKVVRLS
jgi:hypothetical protein